MGTIESLRPVQIEGIRTPIGTLAGTTVGGIAGSSIGGSRGSTISTILGGVAGGAAGSAVEEGITRARGVEIVIREDDGSTRAHTQAVDSGQQFRIGDRVRVRVRVMTVNGASRVTI
ncbi:glycine zipper 2TM domain-containing protein [Pseudomonas aeruginosa]|nr:glycine zipper 2TM domain-containing protein [Pseudomonas aeruginosa]